MPQDGLPPKGRNQTTEEFDRRRRNNNGMSGNYPAYISPEPIQPGIGTDIGNFFRVLFAFLSGLWNRDFAEFDLLSSVYFPPQPPGATDQMTPEQRAQQDNVDRMRNIRSNPNDPAYNMPSRDVIGLVTVGVRRPANFEDIIQIFLPFEGGMNRNEPFGAIANYGINSRAHPDINVENLTRERAVDIYRTRYWNALHWPGGGMDQMSGAVKLIAFDAAANSGVAFGNKILRESYAEANGDVDKMPAIMIAKRRAHYAAIIANNPGEFAKYRNGWESRMRTIEGIINRPDMITPIDQMYATAPAGQLFVISPVDTSRFRVSDDHGVREKHPVTGAAALHRGTDYAVPHGTAMLSTAGGTVIGTKTYNGYGKTLVIAHGNGVFQMYAHLDRYAVTEGQQINRGQLLAYSGNTGTGTGAHLHHEWWIERNGEFYTVDERKAEGKNIKDPAVQDELIRDARTRSGAFSPESTISNDIPAAFKSQMSALTERDRGIVSTGAGGLVANNTPAPGAVPGITGGGR